ncbi:aminoacyl-tRNA hydrolase [Zobellia galactanivorans]|uniref:Peptidyl-tRNA hydrolase n=1 Tax=Zobellia galactanivorans (strain DSM 12802 / CCUG 47099 / CIP 106680 / NCIMB 13871 / Dsij) TaxID=63186 RepID=G0LBM7_ZOBGA|nr:MULTISPECIES: aminoacyl-tRNA hydrolase [Zobellia]MDO6516506.1 aminoacyl-tRNA hydrolase [Zobellia uliginosa]MDO6810120.1 aminoacyl-tRNA hydrolase [Zobellia galactanivorans]OWW27162.1 aminoacyl-tRNA hydrolase [Zobellia sp. OII3]CAZ96297.1 Peptidyl-tRNA hydrolase [Zobellia galactanivorans]
MFHLFKSIFTNNKTVLQETDSMKKYLIVGLGNIGDKYTETRHNIGFKVLDALADKMDFSFETAKLGDIGLFKIKGRSVLCLKPSTFMNLSGKALKYWMDKEKIPLENVLVITDDINLEFGTFRVKTKGSNGGHNGLKDIQNVLQTVNYNRFRFGVGADFGKGRQVEYVLGEWSEAEKEALKERFEKSTELVQSFVLAGVTRTMNLFNGS